jgi:hypothetical protein
MTIRRGHHKSTTRVLELRSHAYTLAQHATTSQKEKEAEIKKDQETVPPSASSVEVAPESTLSVSFLEAVPAETEA